MKNIKQDNREIREIKALRDRQIKEILEFSSPFPIDKAGLITHARYLCNMAVLEVKQNLI